MSNNTNDPSGPISSNERAGEVQNFSQSANSVANAGMQFSVTDPLLRRDYDAAYRGMTQELAAIFKTTEVDNWTISAVADRFFQSAAVKHFRKVDNIVYGGNTASYWIKTELAAAFRNYINNRPMTAANDSTSKETSND